MNGMTSVRSRLLGAVMLLLSSASQAEVVLMPKQLIILKPGVDRIAGTWVAAANNHGAAPEAFSVPILMPSEVKDFQPIEGISANEIQLGQSGLVVQKQFPPGVTVMSVGFIIPASSGLANLLLKAVTDVGELTVMTPKGMLNIQSVDLSEAGSDIQDMERYSVWTSNRMLLASQEIRISVSGVPEGRTKLWAIGGLLGGVLMLAAVILTKKTSPRVQSENKHEFA